MNECQPLCPPVQPRTIRDYAIAVDIEHDVKDSTKLNAAPSEIYRINPSPQVVRTFETIHARLDLLRFVKRNSLELEFLAPFHLVILFSNGISKKCEWSNGHKTRILSSLPPNMVMFNPANHYLRIRTAISADRCQMLMLAIQPTPMSWRNDLEIDMGAMRFQQQIGLDDEGVSQALVAMQQELESPGTNGAFYVDILLFLLLARLTRCSSHLVEPRKAAHTKGGLPNWRLKRAIELLEIDSAKMPTLAEVAGLIGLHPTSFSRGFKQSTGLPPHRYVLEHRVNRAKEMMNDQRLSLTEIALDCGFSGSSQFSVVFKRITGRSPREFRRAL